MATSGSIGLDSYNSRHIRGQDSDGGFLRPAQTIVQSVPLLLKQACEQLVSGRKPSIARTVPATEEDSLVR